MRKNEVALFRDPFRAMDALMEFNPPFFADFGRGYNGMKVDVVEHDDKHVITAALPGYAKEDIKVSLLDGVLTIQADHNEQKEEKDAEGRVLRNEIFHGHVSRSFMVGDGVKEEDIKASYKDGVLSLEVAKKADPAPETKQITIE